MPDLSDCTERTSSSDTLRSSYLQHVFAADIKVCVFYTAKFCLIALSGARDFQPAVCARVLKNGGKCKYDV